MQARHHVGQDSVKNGDQLLLAAKKLQKNLLSSGYQCVVVTKEMVLIVPKVQSG